MFHTFIKSGWRNLVKNRAYSIINISGLSLGLACSLLIALWVIDEYSIDAFHEKGDRIYVVTSKEIIKGEVTYGGYDTPGLLGEELPKLLPEVEYSTGMGWTSWSTLSVGDKKVKMPGNFANRDFLKIFSYPLVVGSRETALESPESIIISRKMAVTLFGSPEQALDKSLHFDNYKDLKVTAVFEDFGNNVSEKLDYIASYQFFIERENNWIKDWNNSGPTTYVLLKEHTDVDAVRAKIQHILKGYVPDYEDDRLELSLQPFPEAYLHSNFKDGIQSGGRIEYVQLFEIVAVFILLIACINFMNMSTARSVKRAKEIGVRKVSGAMRSILVNQFMVEALMSTVIAVVISIILMSLLLPEFNLLTGKNIQSPVTNPKFWIGIGSLTLLTALISGSYPALFLSSFKPIAAMRNNFKISSSSVLFRRGLVVFQFALSIIFVLGMIVITKQVDYIQTKNLGYQKNNLIYLQTTGTIATNFEGFKNELMKIPGVTSVSAMSQRPVELENTTGGVWWEGKSPDEKPLFTQVAATYDLIKVLNAKLVGGRDFLKEHTDSANYIVNESALKIIGYKDPIGMPLEMWGVKGTIIGVVEDFHFNSLHVPIEPLIIRMFPRNVWGFAFIRTEPSKTAQVIEDMEALHKKFNPEFPFAHQFADEEYSSMYQSEQVAQQLSGYFAILSILISCLGLLGLVIFAAAQRMKEVGIRKVLGANVIQIVALLSGDFMKLVGLSMLFSFPVAYYIMNEWLGNFEYRIGMEWWMFVIAGSGAVLIALFTLSFQAIKAALANPVNSLKSE